MSFLLNLNYQCLVALSYLLNVFLTIKITKINKNVIHISFTQDRCLNYLRSISFSTHISIFKTLKKKTTHSKLLLLHISRTYDNGISGDHVLYHFLRFVFNWIYFQVLIFFRNQKGDILVLFSIFFLNSNQLEFNTRLVLCHFLVSVSFHPFLCLLVKTLYFFYAKNKITKIK